MSVGSSSSASHVPLPQPHASGQLRPKLSRNMEDYFCYWCGEYGHISTKCQASENATQVITKLIHSLRKAKGMRSGPNRSNPSGEQACFSKNSHVHTSEPNGLPKGLVGPASTVEVKIGGHPCHALWDSGSQVLNGQGLKVSMLASGDRIFIGEEERPVCVLCLSGQQTNKK